jgi:hypothetical protein
VIRLWDFADCECGKRHNDTPISAKNIPEKLLCGCGRKVGWARSKRNFIHATHSGRKYGEFDPQFGCVVKDYNHKKQLLRELSEKTGMEAHETPPVTVEQAQEDKFNQMARATTRDPNVLTVDSLDEIESLIDQSKVGNRGLSESWID